MMTELTEYAPIGKMKQATYRPAVFNVLAATTKPMIETRSPAVMCHVRSCLRPELHPIAMPAAPAKMNGGHVKTRVIVLLNPKVFTTLRLFLVPIYWEEGEKKSYVGKNELKEQALRWKFCMKQNNQVLLSLHACLSPSIILTASVESPTLSRSIRACASSRSAGLSHRVVRGVFGKRKNPKIATKAVTAPSL